MIFFQREDLVISDLYEQATTDSRRPKSSSSVELTIRNTEEESRNEIYRMRTNIDTWLSSSLPLPRVLQHLIGRLLLRLTKDAQEVILFLRRQCQSIIEVLRGRITDHSREFSHRPTTLTSTSQVPDWVSMDDHPSILVPETTTQEL
jgi:hypothetical protein